MILLHVSFDPVEQFYPRVPSQLASGNWIGEDEKTPRICLSDSIERAITATPGGGFALQGMMACKNFLAPVLHLYFCDTNEDEQGFLSPKIVEQDHGIWDAPSTHEWWALKTPHFAHKIIRVTWAITMDKTDVRGTPTIFVKKIGYQFLEQLPDNAPENLLDTKVALVRLYFIAAGKDKQLAKRLSSVRVQ